MKHIIFVALLMILGSYNLDAQTTIKILVQNSNLGFLQLLHRQILTLLQFWEGHQFDKPGVETLMDPVPFQALDI